MWTWLETFCPWNIFFSSVNRWWSELDPMSSKRSDKRSTEELSRNEIKDEKFRCCSENIVVIVVVKSFSKWNQRRNEKFRCSKTLLLMLFDVKDVIVVKSFYENDVFLLTIIFPVWSRCYCIHSITNTSWFYIKNKLF